MVGTLSEMTWNQVDSVDRSRSVAILPLGAIEAHGPHLPLATDNVIAEAMARDGAERLSRRSLDVLILPTVSYTPAQFAGAFAGTVSLSPETSIRVIVDVGASLQRHGFPWLALANAHFDPSHVGAVHQAVDRLRSRGLGVVFPDLTRRRWAERMTEEFRTGACHAGRYESSVVMAERPDLVDEERRRALPPNPESLSAAIRSGKSTFGEAGGPDAYFGWPAEATSAEGREVVGILGAILEDAVVEALAEGDGGG